MRGIKKKGGNRENEAFHKGWHELRTDGLGDICG